MKGTIFIDRQRASNAFRDYTGKYDAGNITVALKVAHTYRVAGISERIACTISEADINFSWLLGLLHDIGRFEQIRRYGTLRDALSVDHAELGADILFHDDLFSMFVSWGEFESQKLRTVAETAVRLHNKLRIPEDIDAQTQMYAKILRDADKVDIFRVLTEPPYDEIYHSLNDLCVRDEVMQCVNEHRCVPIASSLNGANELESLVAQCCMAFELEYPESRKIVIEQGYLNKLLNKNNSYLSVVKNEIIKAWGT